MGVGVEDFELGPSVNDGSIALRVNTDNFETQQRVYINFRGIVRGGHDYRALRFDVFFAVIADLVGQSLASL